MKGIKNHLFNNFKWYHSTLNGLVKKIQEEGLRINSIPEFQSKTEPWIYVSTFPFCLEKDFSTFEVDLSQFDSDDTIWLDDGLPLEKRWQLRVTKNIPSKYLRLLSKEEAYSVKRCIP